jgi:hypothetical protein
MTGLGKNKGKKGGSGSSLNGGLGDIASRRKKAVRVKAKSNRKESTILMSWRRRAKVTVLGRHLNLYN